MKRIQDFANYLFHRFYIKDVGEYKAIYSYYKHSDIEYKKEFQNKRLKELLKFAIKHNAFYKKWLEQDHKLNVESFGIENIKQLPILKKEVVRESNTLLHSDNHEQRGSYKNTSGGSSGEPILVLQDRQYGVESQGTFLFIKFLRTGEPYCFISVLWGAHRDMYGSDDTFVGKMKSWFNNRVMFNSARQDPDKIQSFIDHINRKKPPMILAYVQSIYQVAVYAEENNIDIKPQKAIHTGAGQLFPFMREKIEKVLGGQVFDHYGGREFGAVATECKYGGGLHILDYNRIVEIVDENGNECEVGVEGDILVTVLNNYSMPLIRYKVGDRGIWAEDIPCKCGVSSRKIARIVGRTSNNFPLANGGYVSGEYLTLSYNHVPGIVNFQIRQKSLTHIVIYLVTNSDYTKKETEQYMKDKMLELFGPELDLKFEYVNEIPSTMTGKHLFTISELHKN